MKETVILTARGWSGAGPWYQTLAFKEPVADGVVSAIQGASDKQKQAFTNGNISISTINGWLVTFKATTNKPIVNIPIEFIYSEAGREALNSVVIVGTKTSGTTFTGTITREAFNKLKEGNVPLIANILDSSTKKTAVAIRMPSYTYDVGSNTLSALAPVIPTAGGSLSFWGLLIKGTDFSVSGFVSAGGGGGGGSTFWGSILGTLSDQTDLQAVLDSLASSASVTALDGRVTAAEGNIVTLGTQVAGKSTVSVSASGIATDVVQYITINGVQKKLPSGGSSTIVWGGITGSIANQADLVAKLNEKINIANIKTAWGATPGDGNVPSEKLVKDSLDEKVPVTDVVSAWNITPSNAKIASEKLTKDTLDLKQTIANLVTSLSSASDNSHYPSAKAVYDFVVENAADFKGSVATKADLATITGMNINDWAIVLTDETQSGKTTRYGYTGSAWSLQWAINNITFTSAQMDSINSGITAAKVATYDGYAATIATKVNKNADITGATKCKITFDSKGLVTAGADLVATDIPDLASSKITAMTGYVKPSATGAISTSDNLNSAMGKLEKGIELKQNIITYGTADPSGGNDGDIYIKYTA